jgi:protein-S-isoprenylcysteine O-methyltransferase Ste14
MPRQLAGLLGYVFLFAVLLFAPAGTVDWSEAWILLAVLLVVRLASTILLYRSQGDLLVERARLPLQSGQPWSDRLLLPAIMASFAALVAFAAWDRWHLRLLPAPPAWIRVVGLLAFAAGWGMVHLALSANAFAVTVVRHQEDRGQFVVTAGPYAVVRHPMYAGLIPIMTGLGLWLGSIAAALGALVPIGLLMARIALEERLLRRVLPAYEAYAARVRWRLVPGVW